MTKKLSKDGKIKYSPMEQTIFSLLREEGEIDTAQITKKFYGKKEVPFNARKIVSGALRDLKRKVVANDEPFIIASSDRSGSISMRYWIEKRR